ncbi:plasmid mobilization protein [Streptomyces sp. NBC_01431]|uniref:plasmid mobilization protein n=1 Tax=Streptomyces sp. NBC_01431 TaxID=2903863 RepID=UPI002E2ECA45|nr:plasmid mobilization relaxosome protein MobC [Streptomyces sp. NBC_01431]
MDEELTPRRAAFPGKKLKRVEEGKRQHVTKVLMSDKEAQLVRGRAIALGVSVPRTLVEAATGVPPLTRTERDAMYMEVMAVRRLLANMANNLNQIARALNADAEFSPDQLRAVLDRLPGTIERVEEMAAKYAA